MSNWASLRTALNTKLSGISALAAVYDHHTATWSGYPAAMFEPSADPDVFATNRDNEHIYAFDIFIVQEITTEGRSAAIGRLVTAVDAVVAALEGDDTLGSACLYSEPAANAWGEEVLENGPCKYARITLRCHVLTQAF